MTCDCALNPHHRWNCHLTPIWAQTMRDLDINPWMVVEGYAQAIGFWERPRGINQWDGLRGTFCGRGPCCLGDGHSGRCRM